MDDGNTSRELRKLDTCDELLMLYFPTWHMWWTVDVVFPRAGVSCCGNLTHVTNCWCCISQSWCKLMGAYLVEIHDGATQMAVTSLINRSNNKGGLIIIFFFFFSFSFSSSFFFFFFFFLLTFFCTRLFDQHSTWTVTLSYVSVFTNHV